MNTWQLLLLYMFMEYLWISTMTPLFYQIVFSDIQKSPMKPNMMYAILAYVLIIMTIMYICVPLSTTYKHTWLAFGMVGLCVYGIYNTTNAAVFKNYPLDMVLIDTMWGFVCFSILGIMYTKD